MTSLRAGAGNRGRRRHPHFGFKAKALRAPLRSEHGANGVEREPKLASNPGVTRAVFLAIAE